MEEATQEPTSQGVAAFATMQLYDGLKFNAKRVGPTTFSQLRQSDYGFGFRMPTMPELIPFVHASLENRDDEAAKSVIRTLRDYWLAGDTGILYTLDGVYVQDNPEMKGGRVSMRQEILEQKLSSNNEKNGVFYSDDGSIRLAFCRLEKGSKTPLGLSRNPMVIAFAGSEENAGKLEKISEHYKSNPWLHILDDIEKPKIRIAGLSSGRRFGCDRLVVDGSLSEDSGRNSCAFGVSEDAKSVKQMNQVTRSLKC